MSKAVMLKVLTELHIGVFVSVMGSIYRLNKEAEAKLLPLTLLLILFFRLIKVKFLLY